MTLQEYAYIGGILAGIGGIGAVIIAWFQLGKLNKSINASNLMTIFEIEFELNRRKERLSEIRKENETLLNKFQNKAPSEEEKSMIEILDNHRKEAYENYLNVFDRLCYFVLNGKLDEEDFRLEYRDMLFNTIQSDKENTFQQGTKYRNMIKLYEQWKDK